MRHDRIRPVIQSRVARFVPGIDALNAEVRPARIDVECGDCHDLPVPHRVSVKPVRVYSYNAELACHSVRTVGYRAHCSCGWRGQVRASVRVARMLGREHKKDAARLAAT